MSNTKNINSIRFSIIDDHPIVAMGLGLMVRKCTSPSITLVNQYVTGAEALVELGRLNSDIVLIDMCLPDMKGYVLAEKILEKYPSMKIGIFSHMLDTEHIVASFKCGVLGYLSKSASSTEVIDFIQTIYRGDRYVKGPVADIIFEHSFRVKREKQFSLTDRESEIIQCVWRGLKNQEIANKLSISLRTVEFHKQNIYQKLEVNNSVDLCKHALQLNLISTS